MYGAGQTPFTPPIPRTAPKDLSDPAPTRNPGKELRNAAFQGNVPLAEKLLAEARPPSDAINCAGPETGDTPLHNAIKGCLAAKNPDPAAYEALIKLLISLGADLTLQNKAGKTPVDLAMASPLPPRCFDLVYFADLARKQCNELQALKSRLPNVPLGPAEWRKLCEKISGVSGSIAHGNKNDQHVDAFLNAWKENPKLHAALGEAGGVKLTRLMDTLGAIKHVESILTPLLYTKLVPWNSEIAAALLFANLVCSQFPVRVEGIVRHLPSARNASGSYNDLTGSHQFCAIGRIDSDEFHDNWKNTLVCDPSRNGGIFYYYDVNKEILKQRNDAFDLPVFPSPTGKMRNVGEKVWYGTAYSYYPRLDETKALLEKCEKLLPAPVLAMLQAENETMESFTALLRDINKRKNLSFAVESGPMSLPK